MIAHRCQDPRCLFEAKGAPLDQRAEVVATDTREGEGLWERCAHCALAINRRGVPPEVVAEFYNGAYQEKNSFEKGARLDARKHFEIRRESIRPRAEYLKRFLQPSSVVFELGGGSGELLHFLKPHARRCIGNELVSEFVEFMERELGLEAFREDYLDWHAPEPLDLAISVGTLDHIYNPADYVRKIHRDLKPGGLLYVEVPNDVQALKTLMPGPHAEAFKRYMYQTAHYYSFTFDTLSALLREAGFEIAESFSRHDYSILNFLHWYFTGSPQKSIFQAKSGEGIFPGSTGFEKDMNQLLATTDARFREIIAGHRLGESVCILARK